MLSLRDLKPQDLQGLSPEVVTALAAQMLERIERQVRERRFHRRSPRRIAMEAELTETAKSFHADLPEGHTLAATPINSIQFMQTCRRDTVVTTNRRFADWGEVFPNAACVVSLVDRLMHRAEVVRIDGKFYRQKEADERVAQRTAERAAKGTPARQRKARE